MTNISIPAGEAVHSAVRSHLRMKKRGPKNTKFGPSEETGGFAKTSMTSGIRDLARPWARFVPGMLKEAFFSPPSFPLWRARSGALLLQAKFHKCGIGGGSRVEGHDDLGSLRPVSHNGAAHRPPIALNKKVFLI